MSARKLDPHLFDKSGAETTQTLTLPASAVRVRKNGIEFRHSRPIAPWTEMMLAISREGGRKTECNGVIVACSGEPRQGYTISMLFTHLTPQARTQLMSYS